MKNPILILFLILNLLAINLVSAMNIYNEDTSESHLVHSSINGETVVGNINAGDTEALLVSCVDESSCDHFCHISSHMVGYISQFQSLPLVNDAIAMTVIKQQFHSLILDPPFLPPKA